MKGRVLYVSKNRVFLARNQHIYVSEDNGGTWQRWRSIPANFFERAGAQFALFARLLRLGIQHLYVVGDIAVIFANRRSYLVQDGIVTAIDSPVSVKTLVPCVTSDSAVYFGEYRSNEARLPVSVFRLDVESARWRVAFRFDGVRHIHGIFQDPFSQSLWITTGDSDEESAIWTTEDEFKTVERVAGGSQQLRAVQLLFTKDFIYFGSDAPEEVNAIYRLDRRTKGIKRLVEVGNTVFFGYQKDGLLCFSTAVEPSRTNTRRYTDVWCSRDGTVWKKVYSKKKDWLSSRYFQYGQLQFPSGPGDGENLWFASRATGYSDETVRIPFAQLEHALVVPVAGG